MDRLTALVLDEGSWLTASMVTAALVCWGHWRSQAPAAALRARIEAALTLYFVVTIAVMAFGHLLAVTTKLALGTLAGSRLAFYAIGAVLAVPSWWLTAHTLRTPPGDGDGTSRALTVWTIVALLALGLHNLPLAAPGVFALAYRGHARPVAGRILLGAALVAIAGLLVGSLVFMASGQTFEQFRDLD
ncbi:MAG: hypothetical protein AB7H93_00015 [Vicinamibacterales bacterium]